MAYHKQGVKICMKNLKNWIIIACLLGAAVLILLTNTTVLNKVIVILVALIGTAVMIPSRKK